MRFAILLLLSGLIAETRVSFAQETRVTVSQLEQFLTSRHVLKKSDAEIASQLASATLSEQLTQTTLARIVAKANLGPQTTEQLTLLADSSVFRTPPGAEIPHIPVPDEAAQQRMIDAARTYVSSSLQALPDFLAIRTTRSYDNAPQLIGAKHPRTKVELHFVHETCREIGFRRGREVSDASSHSLREVQPSAASGLTTWGEFGPILKTVLEDSFQGNVAWSRWQLSETRHQLAVFRFAIPKTASHYLVDFCCYQKSEDNPESFSFRDDPAYHGELYIDPDAGSIDRITIEAELNETGPVTTSSIAVRYGPQEIGGKTYICPISGVALSQFHNRSTEHLVGPVLETHINIIRFIDYHKFGSTSRILDSSPYPH